MIGLAVWLALTAQTSSPAIGPAITPVKPLSAARVAAPPSDTFDAALVAQAPARKP